MTARTTSALLALAVCLGTAGCGETQPSRARSGGLTIVLAAPKQGPNGAQGRDLVRAAQLELDSVKSTVAGRRIQIRQLNESGPNSTDPDPEHVAALVEQAAADPNTVGWLGGLDSDSFAVELPRLNEAGLAAVSPGATATPFNRRDPAFPGAPVKYYPAVERFGASMARTTTNDLAIARLALGDLRAKGITRVLTVDIGDTDGDSFSSAIEQIAPRLGLSLVGHESVVVQNADWQGIALEARNLRAQAIVWSSAAGPGQADLWRAVGLAKGREHMVSGPAVPPSALSSLPSVLGHVVAYGPLVPSVHQGSDAGRFSDRFKRVYGHAPAPGSLRGGASMAILLQAIQLGLKAREADPELALRDAVARGLGEVRSSRSLLGDIALNRFGDWVEAPVGKWTLGPSGLKFDGLIR